MNCPQCGILNAVENEFCSACGGRLRATGGPPAVAPVARVFRNPKRLTWWLQSLLIGIIVVEGGLAAFQLLQLRAGGAVEADNLVTTVLGTGLIMAYIATIVMFCVWTYRANANIHALGAANLRFSPGWAVGWYFVPIANLWKPYQVMNEIWRASKSPNRWYNEASSSIVGWWWFWFVISNVQVSIGASPQQEALESAISPSGLISIVLDVIAAVLAFRVVKRVGLFQAEASERSVSAVFA